MSFWKVLGGAAAGIACVVALPVAGPIGAVTGVGALIAAGTGAAAGGIASAVDDTEDQAEQRGREKEASKHAEKIKKILAAFEELEKRNDDSKCYFDLILAMEAVGMACAACNGHIATEQRQEISEFTSGVAGQSLPDHIKTKIKEIADSPPNIGTAYAMAKNLNLESMEPFDEIINAVMHADGIIHDEEVEFKKHWNQLKAAA